jgi:hypothetical protein
MENLSKKTLFLSFQEIGLQLMRYYLKEKMKMGITKEREEKISEKIKEVNETLDRVKNWYNSNKP